MRFHAGCAGTVAGAGDPGSERYAGKGEIITRHDFFIAPHGAHADTTFSAVAVWVDN